MGVHNLDVYPEVKRLFEMPEDEPIFVLRAQDRLYVPTISAYEALFMAALNATGVKALLDGHWEFADHLDSCADTGRRWAKRNPEKMKIPD